MFPTMYTFNNICGPDSSDWASTEDEQTKIKYVQAGDASSDPDR